MDAHNAQCGLPTKYPVHRCAFAAGCGLTAHQRELIALGVNMMNALGPTSVWVTDGTETRIYTHWADDNSINPTPAPRNDAARTTWLSDNKALIEFDPVGLHGDGAWKLAAAHETGHGFGLPHIDVTEGYAIMNPNIPETKLSDFPVGIEDLDTKNTMEGSPVLRGPTQLDFDAYDKLYA